MTAQDNQRIIVRVIGYIIGSMIGFHIYTWLMFQYAEWKGWM